MERGSVRQRIDLSELLERVEFQWPFPVHLFVRAERLFVRISVPDREDFAERVLTFSYTIPLLWSETVALNFIRYCLGACMVHEIDEGLYFDGSRVYDPHFPTERT